MKFIPIWVPPVPAICQILVTRTNAAIRKISELQRTSQDTDEMGLFPLISAGNRRGSR